MLTIRNFILLVSCIVSLSACGQYGRLYLPHQEPTSSIEKGGI